jgi:hypothetical protein
VEITRFYDCAPVLGIVPYNQLVRSSFPARLLVTDAQNTSGRSLVPHVLLSTNLYTAKGPLSSSISWKVVGLPLPQGLCEIRFLWFGSLATASAVQSQSLFSFSTQVLFETWEKGGCSSEYCTAMKDWIYTGTTIIQHWYSICNLRALTRALLKLRNII